MYYTFSTVPHCCTGRPGGGKVEHNTTSTSVNGIEDPCWTEVQCLRKSRGKKSRCKKTFPVCITARRAEEKCFSLEHLWQKHNLCRKTKFLFCSLVKEEEVKKLNWGCTKDMGSKRQNPFLVLSIFFNYVRTLEERLRFPVTHSQKRVLTQSTQYIKPVPWRGGQGMATICQMSRIHPNSLC